MDESLNNLRKTIQSNVNEQLKSVIEQCKKDFIIPALKNNSLNSGLAINGTSDLSSASSSCQDVTYLVVNLVEEARQSFINEIQNKVNGGDVPMNQDITADDLSPDLSTSSSSGSPLNSLKRKNDSAIVDENNNNTNNDSYANMNENDHKKSKCADKKAKLSAETKFLLGKNVNDIFFEQSQNANNSDYVSSNENNHKSIYSTYPSLFKYEADATDRQWLTEHSIIKRKNLKCFILLFSEIEELFANFKLDKADNNELDCDEKPSSNTSNSSNNVLYKKLKPFSLPETILYKVNKQYLYNKKIWEVFCVFISFFFSSSSCTSFFICYTLFIIGQGKVSYQNFK